MPQLHPALSVLPGKPPVRTKLKHLLPAGIAVGSGCVIDSYGGTSRQMDVVLYEEALCPVYSVNDDPATTYYPCEGVLAVGEVKSALGSAELEDAFAKIASAKELRRFVQPSDDATPFRTYGSPLSIQGTEEQAFNEDKPLDQIFGFCIAGRLNLKAETACRKYVEFCKTNRRASESESGGYVR